MLFLQNLRKYKHFIFLRQIDIVFVVVFCFSYIAAVCENVIRLLRMSVRSKTGRMFFQLLRQAKKTRQRRGQSIEIRSMKYDTCKRLVNWNVQKITHDSRTVNVLNVNQSSLAVSLQPYTTSEIWNLHRHFQILSYYILEFWKYHYLQSKRNVNNINNRNTIIHPQSLIMFSHFII